MPGSSQRRPPVAWLRMPQLPASAWPALPYEEWRPTKETVHRFTQIMGKLRMTLVPFRNHWWHVTLAVSAHGVTTGRMPFGERSLEVELDVVESRLRVRTSDGADGGFPLRGRQSFFEGTHYCRFDNAGRDKESDDPGVLVRRESTLSSIATGADPFVAGGHLGKELVAARYSSAGASLASGGPPPRWPDAMTPSEDSRVHQGVLAAGSRSGSVVPLGGTSVAAPQMARWIADNLPAASHATLAGAAIPMTAATPPERKGAGRLPVTPLVKLRRYEFP